MFGFCLYFKYYVVLLNIFYLFGLFIWFSVDFVNLFYYFG